MISRIALLISLAVAALMTALAAWNSVTSYRTPYAFHADLPPGEPLTERVALIVLDGVRQDVVTEMEFLGTLAASGAAGTVTVGIPSLSNPSRTVMVTGAWPEINGLTNNSDYSPVEVDSLFSAAKREAIPAAAAGSFFWRDAFGDQLDPASTQVHEKRLDHGTPLERLIEWQRETCEEDLRFVRRFSAGFLVVGVTAADAAGHDFGGASGEYRRAARAVDACVASMVGTLDDGRTTFVITSDHGHVDAGGHGGYEAEVINVPLVLAGKAIRASSGWSAPQVDIAPTISALLGLPFPATNQGSILWQVLDLSAEQRASLGDRARSQRELAASRLPDREQISREEKRDRSLRALAIFTSFWFLACAVVLSDRGQWWGLLAALGIYYAIYHLLFPVLGLHYSLSAINRQEYLFSFLGKNWAVSALAFCLASLAVVRKTQKRTGLEPLNFALLVAATLVWQVTWNYYQHGLFMQRVMPDLEGAFRAYLELVQLAAVGFTAPLVALVARHGRAPAAIDDEKRAYLTPKP